MSQVTLMTLVGIGILIANLVILGYNIKLYTEFFKERVKGK